MQCSLRQEQKKTVPQGLLCLWKLGKILPHPNLTTDTNNNSNHSVEAFPFTTISYNFVGKFAPIRPKAEKRFFSPQKAFLIFLASLAWSTMSTLKTSGTLTVESGQLSGRSETPAHCVTEKPSSDFLFPKRQ